MCVCVEMHVCAYVHVCVCVRRVGVCATCACARPTKLMLQIRLVRTPQNELHSELHSGKLVRLDCGALKKEQLSVL